MTTVTLWCPPALGQQMVQVGTAAPVALAADNTVTVDISQVAALTAAGFLRVPNRYSIAPTPATAGAEYFDTTLNRKMVYNGTVWQAARTDGDLIWQDFLGSLTTQATTGTSAIDFINKLTGTSSTGGIVSAVANGVVELALASASEAEESVLYQHDVLMHGTGAVGSGYTWQARAFTPVTPTSGSILALGMGSANAAGPLGLSYYMFFVMTGSGVVAVKTLDDNGAVVTTLNTAVTLATTDYHTFEIDTHNITNATTGAVSVLFSIDGVLQATVAMTLSSTHGWMQPYATAYKASGTSVGTLGIDYVRTWR